MVVPSAWAEPIKIVDQVKSTPPIEEKPAETCKSQKAISSSAPGAQVNILSAKTVRQYENYADSCITDRVNIM